VWPKPRLILLFQSKITLPGLCGGSGSEAIRVAHYRSIPDHHAFQMEMRQFLRSAGAEVSGLADAIEQFRKGLFQGEIRGRMETFIQSLRVAFRLSHRENFLALLLNVVSR